MIWNASRHTGRIGLPWRMLLGLQRLFALVGVLFIIYHVGFDLSVITSGSMAPTLQGTSVDNGDWVLTERVSYWFRRPHRWEVVTFRDDDGTQIMKRVVGLPSEKVALEGNRLCVNGTQLGRPASLGGIEYLAVGHLFRGKVAQCHSGYFVLGDDSRDSWDSRFTGPIQSHRLVGHAWAIIWPPDRIGFIDP